MTVTDVAKTVATNLQGSCLAAVALAAMMAGLTYMSLREEQAQSAAHTAKRQEIILEVLRVCPMQDRKYLAPGDIP
jgi:hypothetical protein